MSDLLIKDVGLPNPNEVLWLAISHDGTVKEGYGQIMDSKAIEVPPHGRIVDLDKVLDWLINRKKAFSVKTSAIVIKALKSAPTILEANKWT